MAASSTEQSSTPAMSEQTLRFQELFFPSQPSSSQQQALTAEVLDSFITYKILLELIQNGINFIHEIQEIDFPTGERYTPNVTALQAALNTRDSVTGLTLLDHVVMQPLKEKNFDEKGFFVPSQANIKNQHCWFYHWFAAGAIATNIGNDGLSTLDRYVLHNEFPPHTHLDQAIALLNYGARFIRVPEEHEVRLRIQRAIEQQKQAYQDTLLEQIKKLKLRLGGRIKQDPLHTVLENKINALTTLYHFVENSDNEAPLERTIYEWMKQTSDVMDTLAKHEYLPLFNKKKTTRSYHLVVAPLNKHYFYTLSAMCVNPLHNAIESLLTAGPPSVPHNITAYYTLTFIEQIGLYLDNWSQGSPLAEGQLKALIHQHYKMQAPSNKLFTIAEKEKNITTTLRNYITKAPGDKERTIDAARLFIFIETLYTLSREKNSLVRDSLADLKKHLLRELMLWRSGREIEYDAYAAIFTVKHPVAKDTLFLHFLKTCNPQYKQQNDRLITIFLSHALLSRNTKILTDLATAFCSQEEREYSALDTYALAFQATQWSTASNYEFNSMIMLLDCGFCFNLIPSENLVRHCLEGIIRAEKTEYTQGLQRRINILHYSNLPKKDALIVLKKFIEQSSPTHPRVLLVASWLNEYPGYAKVIRKTTSVSETNRIVQSILWFSHPCYPGGYSMYNTTAYQSIVSTHLRVESH